MYMDITIAQEVISYLKTNFDSHDFIRMLLEKHPEEYGEILVKHGRNGGSVATADGEISKYLADHSTELSITRTGNALSGNILGHFTECATWSK